MSKDNLSNSKANQKASGKIIASPRIHAVHNFLLRNKVMLMRNTHTDMTELWEYNPETKSPVKKISNNWRSVEARWRGDALDKIFYQNKKGEDVSVKTSAAFWQDATCAIGGWYSYDPVDIAWADIRKATPATEGSLLRIAFKIDWRIFDEVLIKQERAVAYIDALSKLILANLYRRSTNAGCEVHIVPILYSLQQGIIKSHFCKLISPVPELVTQALSGKLLGMDDTAKLGRKIYGMLVAELGELHLRNADLDIVKANITANNLRFDFKFKDDDNYPRTDMMIGTTNRDKFLLKDESGYRRFPIAPLLGQEDIAKAIKDTQAQRDSYLMQAANAVEDGLISETGEFKDEEFIDYQHRIAQRFAWQNLEKAEEISEELHDWITENHMHGKSFAQRAFVKEKYNGKQHWRNQDWAAACEMLNIKPDGRIGGRRAWLVPEHIEQ